MIKDQEFFSGNRAMAAGREKSRRDNYSRIQERNLVQNNRFEKEEKVKSVEKKNFIEEIPMIIDYHGKKNAILYEDDWKSTYLADLDMNVEVYLKLEIYTSFQNCQS